eukprot:Gb_41394 [translate_table: standard]
MAARHWATSVAVYTKSINDLLLQRGVAALVDQITLSRGFCTSMEYTEVIMYFEDVKRLSGTVLKEVDSAFNRTKAASSFVPITFRNLKQQGLFHTALGFAIQTKCREEVTKGNLWISRGFASSIAPKSKAEENLLRVLDYEIKCAVESDPPTEDEVPEGSIPFTVEDIPGEQSVILRRKYGNEDIKVEVLAMDIGALGQRGDDDEEEIEKGGQANVNLTVTVSKGEGPSLEFICTAYPDKVIVDVMAIKEKEQSADHMAYEGPSFQDLDENLQKGFHKFLEVRGIKGSLSSFLAEYMINKDSREYIRWLKNVKAFVEK